MTDVLNVALLAAKSDTSLGKAAIIAVLGIVIVFAVLGVLVGILTLFKLIFNVKILKKSKKAVTSAQNATKTESETDDGELIAVIAAAIACLDGEETIQAPFKIKSINRLK
ncbi:MAG: OadG family protein [Clostridia bacterium]|nr:OadG family protein [Clostridia bacterium]